MTGVNLGEWYFGDLAMWFLLMSIIIAFLFKIGEKKTVSAFIVGANDMLSVVLIIVVARGVSALMSSTNLDLFLLDRASNLLNGLSPILFILGSYVIYFLLSFLIPSSSGLAYVSMPIMGGLAHRMGCPPEVMIMIFSATHGVINLISPTSGILMGTLELNRVEYGTWIKFIKIPIITIIVINLISLIITALVL